MVSVEICMGSSCYSRGNSKALEIAEAFIEERNLQNEVRLSGKLCLESCSEGPNIIVNGILHRKCEPECITDLISHYLRADKNEDTDLY